MYGVVYVTAQIVDQVFTNNAHQVVADHLDVVLDRVVANVGVDGGKALGNRAGALHGSLVNQLDLHIGRGPLLDLERGTARSHTTADDQNIDIVLDNFRIGNRSQFAQRLIR
ncbi:MAG: hypothetical protein ACD_75C02056G0002 [uncultured bacterium]|nr:MAG: hypothetical protein ACD_75C02056G0002 [uncultured bacterium]